MFIYNKINTMSLITRLYDLLNQVYESCAAKAKAIRDFIYSTETIVIEDLNAGQKKDFVVSEMKSQTVQRTNYHYQNRYESKFDSHSCRYVPCHVTYRIENTQNVREDLPTGRHNTMFRYYDVIVNGDVVFNYIEELEMKNFKVGNTLNVVNIMGCRWSINGERLLTRLLMSYALIAVGSTVGFISAAS